MADDTLLQLLIELMATYDSTIDTTSGSKFRTDVMDPFLERIGDSPLDTDLESFLVSRLEVEHPDLDVSSFSGIRDLVVRPMKTMLEPIRREINAAKIRQSILNYDQLTKEELNTLLENFFLSVNDGDLATGTVRVYFNSPQSVVVPSTAKFFTDSGLEFVPVSSSAISSTEMAFNFSNNEYFFDVDVQAASVGTSYNIGSGQIIRVDGILSATRVSNLAAIVGGTSEETNAEAITRAKNSIGVKNLVTKRGIKTVLLEAFPTIQDIKVVGFGEPEMVRDIIEGPVQVSGVPGGVPNSNVDVSSNIHIGGKTDVYIKMPDTVLASNTLEIQNIKNYGSVIQSSSTGEVQISPYGSPLRQNLTDVNGFFRDVGSDGTYFILIDDSDHEILSVSGDTTLVFDAASAQISSPRAEISYQIVRRDLDGTIKIPLTNLAAEDSNGDLVLTSGVPSRVIPGSPDNEAYTTGGATVALTENIAIDGNIKIPLFNISSVSLINQSAGTRDEIPIAGIGFAKSKAKFSGGGSSSTAEGTIRYFLPSKTNAILTAQSYEYADLDEDLPFSIPKATWKDSSGNTYTSNRSSTGVTIGSSDIGWDVDGSHNYFYLKASLVTTHSIKKGDWIIFGGTHSNFTVNDRILLIESVSEIDFQGAFMSVMRKVTVRYDGAVGTSAFNVTNYIATTGINSRILNGIHSDDLVQDPLTGYYYYDIDVVATTNGDSQNIEKDVFLTPQDVYTEGYKILSASPGESFSDREIPILYLTRYTNNLNITLTSTSLDVDISYTTGSELSNVQSYVDLEDNRIVSEDILIKHYKPVYMILNISGKGLTDAKGLELLESFVESLDTSFEISDLIHYMYSNGATRIDLPIEIVLERFTDYREYYNSYVENTITIDSNEKFYFSISSSYTVTT